MGVNEAYVVTESIENRRPWSISRTNREDQAHTFDEALDLAGNGFYTVSLLATLSIATLSMAVDIFGFSVVVTGASCDFELGLKETSILLSVTFIGPVVMAYPWGYLSDTQGRRKSLIISLWTSFLMSAASAFSPDWITLAVLKFISTSFSSCAQSATYTLLGESCSQRFRDVYMLIMTSILDFSLAIYVLIAYGTSSMEFSYDLGFINFAPWRVLALFLSMITGLGAFGVVFFYESPKFLLNAERDDEALKVLAGIWRINGGKNEYPVKKVILNEVGNERIKYTSFWKSLYKQLVPLFRPPLLWRSLQLYFITAVVYGTNNGYFMWLPYLGEQLTMGSGINMTSNEDSAALCSLLVSGNSTDKVDCSSKIDIAMVWFSLAQGASFVILLLSITRVAHRKRLLVIIILSISCVSGFGAVLINDMTTGFLMFLGVLLNQLIIGLIYAYYIDLYPTSFRGMAACLSTMVARASALTGVTLMGDYLMTHCTQVFYVTSVLMMCGVLVAFSLPKDKLRRPKP